MKFLRCLAAVVFIVAFASADARPRGITAGNGPTGGAQVGATLNDLFGGVLNTIDTGNQYAFSSGANPSQIDANGYPNATLTAGETINFNVGMVTSQTGSGTQWTFQWTPGGTGTLPFFFNGGWSSASATGCTTSGVSTTTINMTGGQLCTVTFNWTTPPGNNLAVKFLAGSWGTQTSKMVLARSSDLAAIAAGKYWTSEYLTLRGGLNSRIVRAMSLINSGNSANTNQSLFKYRSTPSSLGWMNNRFPPTAWAGASSGTNQYTTTSLPADSGSTGWVDGEVIQTSITNASTASFISISAAVAANASNCSSVTAGLVCLTISNSATLTTGQQVYISDNAGTYESNGVQTVTVVDGTHIALQGVTFVHSGTNAGGLTTLSLTVTGKTGGTVFIATESGSAPGAAFTSGTIPSGLTTLVYDALLGVVKRTGDGITANAPLEGLVALANAANIELWTNIPINDNTYNYAKAEAALIGSSLNSWLKWHAELSNENWNFSFPQFAYLTHQGAVLGGITQLGMQSFRHRQMMAAITSAWTGPSSNLVRVLAWQAAGNSSTTTNLLNSSELNTASNAALLAYAGSLNYTTQGQRAVDFSDAGAYATYYAGALLTAGVCANGCGAGVYQTDAGAIAQIQTLATAFNLNASDPTSLATVDNDFRQGTVHNNTIASVSGTTINATANGLSNNQIGVFTNSGGSVYTGVSLNTPYYVVSAATNSFSVSTTLGGSAISLSGGSGTNSFGVIAGETMLNLATTLYQNVNGNTTNNPGWETVAATYDSYRTSVSQAKLWIDNYEGALEAIAPTTAQCTTMGVTAGGTAAGCSAALAAGLAAYKNSSAAATLALAQFNQMMGRDSTQPLTFGLMAHSRTPSWFLLAGSSQWSLLPGDPGTTPYQTYNGVASFH